MKFILTILSFIISFSAISQDQGKLFIIGGGKRPQPMIERLVQEAGIAQGGYGIILPMSSSEPDSSAWYARQQFLAIDIENVTGMNFNKGDKPTSAQLDSIKNAQLIYISGGDQNKFMDIIQDTGIKEAIHQAYKNGSIIAGTSAGAAVMSKKMITGNELKHPDYSSTFRNIEADNIEIAEGLGLVTGIIIDQHFVKRSRYNRLLSAAIEYPDHTGIGVDESTAVIYDGVNFEVVGNSQVVVFRNPKNSLTKSDDLLGARNLSIDIFLPGDTFTTD
ncbi:cyanophycinase [Fulvivirga sp. RKSG066]|uniref:cyanophycinase n=1 Tax=Fulvivirga aurantia TaxID=2529383 RepID=UPI0012BBD306|nr:cyanophycinase [Fulvivirga aurantia]MTI20872.1 cyanophycinase [Fulvivirga aurantia]